MAKKFDLPKVQPLTEAQRENKMLEMVHQAVGQAFTNHGHVMTSTVHNAVVGTLQGTAGQGFMGPVYHQPSQFNFAPIGPSMTPPPLASLPQPAVTVAPSQGDPIYSTPPLLTTTVQGASGFPVGWDPSTGFGMPPETFMASSSRQNNTADPHQTHSQQNVPATQPMTQEAFGLQQDTTRPTPVSQVNASAQQPIPQQINTALRPTTP